MMTAGGARSQERVARRLLAAAAIASIALKAATVHVGAPQFMIDDFSLYEGGFLVWFGQAPPQHAFLESWLCGATALACFAVKTILAGQRLAGGSDYFVTRALRDFYNHPDAYYVTYRSFLIGVDMLTALFVWRLARATLEQLWTAVWVTVLFLFTYNTLWCALVGRPDTLMACAATAGLYCYVRSEGDSSKGAFWAAAVCFGLAAGLKMHGGLLTVFAAIDLLRRNGLRRGCRRAVPFATVAVAVFAAADGSVLYDPLLYVKARLSTYHDDVSSYLHWGQQFVVMLRSTAWVIAPVALASAVVLLRDARASRALKTIAVFGAAWLVVFSLTRPLRGYWMLSAAPLFYILSAAMLARVPRRGLRRMVMAGIAALMAGQTAMAAWQISRIDVGGLREWVAATVKPGERFYIVGDAILRLPKNTETMRVYKAAYEREMAADLEAGRPFVERHAKNWEEAAQLRLFDMLGFHNDGGRAFYSYRDMPPEKYGDLVPLDGMDYLIVQQQFPLEDVPGLDALLLNRFGYVCERRAEGGDGRGLIVKIYRRRS